MVIGDGSGASLSSDSHFLSLLDSHHTLVIYGDEDQDGSMVMAMVIKIELPLFLTLFIKL